jgi:hypothetical protein
MRNRILTSLAIVAAIIAGGLSVDTGLPPHVDGPRTAHLEVCISDPAEWAAWALAWCPDGDVQCIDDNDDVQGVPYCVDGVEVGRCAKTHATVAQQARMDAAGVVLGGAEVHGWTACPDVVP